MTCAFNTDPTPLDAYAQKIQADPHFLPRSLGRAITYFLNDYTPIVRYLRNGTFEADSNLVDNDVRPSAGGSKRWLFIGHPQAG